MTEVAAAPPQEPASPSSRSVDVDAVLASLSDLGRRVAPAEHVRVATFVPPYPDAPVHAFYTAIEPSDEWGSLPVPPDISAALKPLLGLQSSVAREHPCMQGIYRLLAHELGCGWHMRRDAADCCAASSAAASSYDPAVLFEWLMREDVRRRDELRVADRSMPMPLYDPNRGFHESDISAYTSERLLDERWGPRRVPLTADDLATATSDEADGRPVSVHAKGGLTWMQKALDSQGPFENASDYFVYREQMTTAMGRNRAVHVRTDVASYPLCGVGRETFHDAVAHRSTAQVPMLAAAATAPCGTPGALLV